MKKLLALALVVSTIAASAPAFAVDTKISALCGPDGPEAYKRPGGYCEQLGINDSESSSGRELPFWWYWPV